MASSTPSVESMARIWDLICEANRLINLIDSFTLTGPPSNASSSNTSSQAPVASSSTVATTEVTSKKARISGLNKLKRRVLAELDFLKEVHEEKVPFKKEYLSCSNLPHYAAVIDRIVLEGPENVIAVSKIFHIVNQGNGEKNEKEKRAATPVRQARMEVDIVCKKGACWIKVKAMSPEGVQAVVDGTATPGHKSVLQIADELLLAAGSNPVHYLPPAIVFHFNKGVGRQVARALTKKGLIVEGELVDVQDAVFDSDSDTDEELNSSEDESLEMTGDGAMDATGRTRDGKDDESMFTMNATQEMEERRINVVNLDVTTLITMVSNITNGDVDCSFEDELLMGQLQEELSSPSLPPLLEFLKDKDVVITQMAKEKFLNIVRIVGGPKEQERAQLIFSPDSGYRLIPDAPSSRLLEFKAPKVKDQHRVIFGTADAMKATTVTANVAFVRTAKQHLLPLSTYLHPARALTEQKAIHKNAATPSVTSNQS